MLFSMKPSRALCWRWAPSPSLPARPRAHPSASCAEANLPLEPHPSSKRHQDQEFREEKQKPKRCGGLRCHRLPCRRPGCPSQLGHGSVPPRGRRGDAASHQAAVAVQGGGRLGGPQSRPPIGAESLLRSPLPNFLGPPLAAGGCWVRGVSAGAVLAMQHRRAGAAGVASRSSGRARPAGMGMRVGTRGQTGPSLPTRGSRATTGPPHPPPRDEDMAKGRVASGSPMAGDGGAARSFLCLFFFSLFFPPSFGFWQRCWEGLASGSSPPPPRPCARAGDGRGAPLSCGSVPAPRSLPISLRAGTAGGSGGSGGEAGDGL